MRKKVGIAFSAVVIAALLFAALQPKRVYVMRQRMFGQGLAWSAASCAADADCVAIVYRGNGAACEVESGWVTSKKNPVLARMHELASEVRALEISLGEDSAPKTSCDSAGTLRVRCYKSQCAPEKK